VFATTGLTLLPAPQAYAVDSRAEAASDGELQVKVDLGYRTVNAGDEVEFNTLVTNAGGQPSPPLNIAMNIVKTGAGDPVDPEDWSPERTQQLDPLAPGEEQEQNWTVDAILEGDYMVYMTVIPKPSGAKATSQ